jgi:hypothetical protein
MFIFILLNIYKSSELFSVNLLFYFNLEIILKLRIIYGKWIHISLILVQISICAQISHDDSQPTYRMHIFFSPSCLITPSMLGEVNKLWGIFLFNFILISLHPSSTISSQMHSFSKLRFSGSSILKMEATNSTETLVPYTEIQQRHISEDHNLNTHRHDYLRSHTVNQWSSLMWTTCVHTHVTK